MAEIDISKMSREDLGVLSRKYESELNIIRRRSNNNPEGFKRSLSDRQKNYDEVQKRIREIDEKRTGPADPEGTAPSLADAHGNYAEDARTAQIGGIGVKNSNTDPEGVLKAQRKRLEESGVEDAESVPMNQLAGVNPAEVDKETGQRRSLGDPAFEGEEGEESKKPKPRGGHRDK